MKNTQLHRNYTCNIFNLDILLFEFPECERTLNEGGVCVIENFYTVDAYRPRWTQSTAGLKKESMRFWSNHEYIQGFFIQTDLAQERTATLIVYVTGRIFYTAARQSIRTFTIRRRRWTSVCAWRNVFLSPLLQSTQIYVNIRALIIEFLIILQKRKKNRTWAHYDARKLYFAAETHRSFIVKYFYVASG